MPEDFGHTRTSPGRTMSSALSQMNELKGVRASKIGDDIHVHFNIAYKKKTLYEYFCRLERLQDGSWQVFSHSFPHSLPMEAVLKNAPYEDPMAIVKEMHQFLESLAMRKGQVEEAKVKYPEILKITNTATCDLVRLFFTRESEFELLRGIWFDLKYTLLGKFPISVNITLPARTRTNLTKENNNDLQMIMKGFQTYSIVGVINTIVED